MYAPDQRAMNTVGSFSSNVQKEQNQKKKPLGDRNLMKSELSPSSGGIKTFDSCLPGAATPTKQRKNSQKLTTARSTLAQNQERLKNLEKLLATVRDECDTVEKKKPARGFPTPTRTNKRLDLVEDFESVSATSQSRTPTVMTPIKKFLEDEDNDLKKTPKSVTPLNAWRGPSPDSKTLNADTPKSNKPRKLVAKSERPETPIDELDAVDSDDADAEVIAKTPKKERVKRAANRASAIYESTASNYNYAKGLDSPTSNTDVVDSEYLRVTETPKEVRSSALNEMATPQTMSAEYFQVVGSPTVTNKSLEQTRGSKLKTSETSQKDSPYMTVGATDAEQIESQYMKVTNSMRDATMHPNDEYLNVTTSGTPSEYMTIRDMIKQTNNPQYISIDPALLQTPTQNPIYMEVLDTPKYMEVLDTPKIEYMQVVDETLKKNGDNDSLYQYMQVMDSPNKDQDYLQVVDDSEYQVTEAEQKVKGRGASFYDYQMVLGDNLLGKGPTPDLETIAANFPTTSAPAQIHIEAAKGNLQEVMALVVKGIDIDKADSFGRTPVMYALRFSQLATARWLLQHGADINKQSKDRSTALHYASFNGSEVVVRFIVHSRAKLDLTDDEGRTVLHWACNNANVRVLEVLLAESSMLGLLNVRDNSGMTPTMWACFYNQPDHLDCILIHEATLHAMSGKGLTAKSNKRWESQKDAEGKTALHWSVAQGGTTCLKKLISYESSFFMDANGKSVIHSAAESGNKAAIKLIISKRPQCVHDVDNNGRTPLHWATACHHLIAIQALIKLGSFLTRKDMVGKTALDYAVEHNFEPGITLLSEASEFDMSYKPRMGPAAASTSLRAFNVAVPQGAIPPSPEARELFKTLSIGMYLQKFANQGKGPLQKRYFWLDCFTGELCWAKSPKAFARAPELASSEFLVDVSGKSRPVVKKRGDYKPDTTHQYSFTITAAGRELDLVASNETDYQIWIEGLRCLKIFGDHILQVKQHQPLALEQQMPRPKSKTTQNQNQKPIEKKNSLTKLKQSPNLFFEQ